MLRGPELYSKDGLAHDLHRVADMVLQTGNTNCVMPGYTVCLYTLCRQSTLQVYMTHVDGICALVAHLMHTSVKVLFSLQGLSSVRTRQDCQLPGTRVTCHLLWEYD